MKYLKKIFLVFASMTLLAWSCQEDDPDYYTINQEAKEWGVYKLGSWWVYKQENTNITDSIFVSKYEESIYEEVSDKKLQFYKEFFFIMYRNLDDNVITSEYIEPVGYEGTLIRIKESNQAVNSIYDAGLLFLTPEILHNFNYITNTPTQIINIFDSLKIENKYYKNVVHTQSTVTNYITEDNYETVNEYWLSKNNWIIKKIIRTNSDTTIWNLIKLNIIQ